MRRLGLSCFKHETCFLFFGNIKSVNDVENMFDNMFLEFPKYLEKESC